MIVRCPSCKTLYKVADDLVKDTKPAFRCSRCKHTFELGSAETEERPVDQAQSAEKSFPKTLEGRELSFTFTPKRQEREANQKEPVHSSRPLLSTSGEAQNRPPLARRQEATHVDFEFPARSAEMGTGKSTLDESFTSDELDSSIEADRTLNPPERIPLQPSPSQPLPLARETIGNVLPLDPYRDQPASTAPFLTLFGLLIMLFSLLTGFHWVHPNL